MRCRFDPLRSRLFMHLHVGTSGYQYKFWRGSFYSERCKEADMLREYAAKLSTVEINATFYRMPRQNVLEAWAAQVPDTFRFAIKASRRITHQSRLKECDETMAFLTGNTAVLGERLGCLLFQLPPSMRKDLPRLERFLTLIPAEQRATMEFRHRSWFSEDVYELLRERQVAMCISDAGEGEDAVPFHPTTDFGYLRLRQERYSDAELDEVAARIRDQPWVRAYAYFKHEEDAPFLAARLAERF